MYDELTDDELIKKAKLKLRHMRDASVLRLDIESCNLIEALIERFIKTTKE
jgi:hypothetical protein